MQVDFKLIDIVQILLIVLVQVKIAQFVFVKEASCF